MLATSASFEAARANPMLLIAQQSSSSFSVSIAAIFGRPTLSSTSRTPPAMPVTTRDAIFRKTTTTMSSSISSKSLLLSFIPIMPPSDILVQASSSLLSPSKVTALILPMQLNGFLVGMEHQKQKQQQQEQEQEQEPEVEQEEVISATTKTFPNDLDPLQMIPRANSLRSALNLPPATTVRRHHHHHGHRPWIVGHRGTPYRHLENTREGFLTSFAFGTDAVEFDVFLLPKDNTLVCFHGYGSDDMGNLESYCIFDDANADDDPESTGFRSIMDLSYEETQQLQFNTEFREFPCPAHRIANARVPRLQDVLLDVKRLGKQVKIELKGPGTIEPVLELVESMDMVHQCQFSSFHPEIVAKVRQLRPQTIATATEAEENQHQQQQQHQQQYPQYVYKTALLFRVGLPDNFIEVAKSVGASEIHLRYDTCTKDRVAAIHDAGLSSMAWFRGPLNMQEDTRDRFWDVGNEDEAMYQAIMDTGVQQMCVNKPDVLVSMFSKQEKLEEQEEKKEERKEQEETLILDVEEDLFMYVDAKEERKEQEDILILDVEKDLFMYVDKNPTKTDVFL